ncbi:protein phosphatase 5 [Clathrospora elynae]|uniref:Serine/threonine-protein phosphatase n=1 Tax=Clathrospora elynae TaxID=706981 RepID=A0A6A5T2H1_9PLEO|nr:protein phosphatase 5 [Clathrospora elynae]
MGNPPEAAVKFKDQGNNAFRNQEWDNALDFYTKAIEAYNAEPSFYTNRAQLEQYGYAIQDADTAIELDPNNVKAFYRRASANTAILKHREALRDWKLVVKKAPNDANAKLRMAECEKVVKRDAFLKAIEVDDAPSAAEGLDVEHMVVDSSYDGAKLEDKMTLEFVDDMIERFKNGKKLAKKYVYQIIIAVMDLVRKEPTMVEYDVAEGHEITWLYPDTFFLNRGNHETDDMNRMYGFEGECKAKYTDRVFKLFSESFSALPLATLIGKKYFVLHGGLFSDDKVTLDDVRKLDRFKQRQPGQAGLMMEMLWTDPQTNPGRGPSKRGVGLQFGPDVTKRFCENNGLEAIIRSHEVRMEGYEVEHDGRCITVFSAPNYCDSTHNKGAFIKIGPEYKLKFTQFDAVPHPNIKPMAYASNGMAGMI